MLYRFKLCTFQVSSNCLRLESFLLSDRLFTQLSVLQSRICKQCLLKYSTYFVNVSLCGTNNSTRSLQEAEKQV